MRPIRIVKQVRFRHFHRYGKSFDAGIPVWFARLDVAQPVQVFLAIGTGLLSIWVALDNLHHSMILHSTRGAAPVAQREFDLDANSFPVEIIDDISCNGCPRYCRWGCS